MRDVVLLLVVVGFFAVAAAYVRACAAIVGNDSVTESPDEIPDSTEVGR